MFDTPEISRELFATQQKLEKTGYKNTELHFVVKETLNAIEDAADSNRALLKDLTNLSRVMVTTLLEHGNQYELYEREGELRVHTSNCDDNGVTSFQSEVLVFLTLGLATPAIRHHQSSVFDRAKIWTPPPHYTFVEFARTGAVAGYYDRVKVRVLFRDDDLVKDWREQLDRIVDQSQSRRGQLA